MGLGPLSFFGQWAPCKHHSDGTIGILGRAPRKQKGPDG
ncbi:uncharacterized protein G2W53_011392 [Senna tora]|uniref:Uncharacterized protein n=1 Tax=Senna tora TaxID=362788 RepID=A0A834X2X1_9FABA|nr:uncharacterized protein G2W53_011392 [Senna tora]